MDPVPSPIVIIAAAWLASLVAVARLAYESGRRDRIAAKTILKRERR